MGKHARDEGPSETLSRKKKTRKEKHSAETPHEDADLPVVEPVSSPSLARRPEQTELDPDNDPSELTNTTPHSPLEAEVNGDASKLKNPRKEAWRAAARAAKAERKAAKRARKQADDALRQGVRVDNGDAMKHTGDTKDGIFSESDQIALIDGEGEAAAIEAKAGVETEAARIAKGMARKAEHKAREAERKAQKEERKAQKQERQAQAEERKAERAERKAKKLGVTAPDASTIPSFEHDVAEPPATEAKKGKTKKKSHKVANGISDGPANPARTKDGRASINGVAQGVPSGVFSNGDATRSGDASASPNRYTEDPELADLPQSDVDEFLKSSLIAVSQSSNSKPSYRPIMQFSYLPSSEKESLSAFPSFTSPTPIQAAAWPWLFVGRDVVGVAETGSGKTLAFGLPCVRHILGLPKKHRKGVKAVIMSPTRELALQSHEEMVKLASPKGLKVACVYGGVPKPPQQEQVRSASIIVATPGRLEDLMEDGSADLTGVRFLVLDEADRMLDQGFQENIKNIAGSTMPTPERQTLMFTATWPPSIHELAATFMTNPVKINIGENVSNELRANTRIEQVVEVMQPMDKQARLIQLLKEYQKGKKKHDRILVFCLYKKEAVRIEEFIRRKGFAVGAIHGDMTQPKRTESLDAFKQGTVSILVATDVAARGLDIPAVKLVLNFTFPLTAEDYVHRIGRTGRAGSDGKAITFFTDQEKGLSGSLVNVLKAAKQEVPEALIKFGTTVKKKGHEAYGAFYKDVDTTKKATRITFD